MTGLCPNQGIRGTVVKVATDLAGRYADRTAEPRHQVGEILGRVSRWGRGRWVGRHALGWALAECMLNLELADE